MRVTKKGMRKKKSCVRRPSRRMRKSGESSTRKWKKKEKM